VAAALASSTVTWTGKRFVVTSPTSGTSSKVGTATAPTAGGAPSNVSTLLGLTAAAGASPSDNASGLAKPSSESFDRARRLPALLNLAPQVELMQTMGLGFQGASRARDISGVTDSAWENRGSIDLTFQVINREAVALAVIESASLGLQVQEPGGAIRTINVAPTPPT
jgi:hypothetical protein